MLSVELVDVELFVLVESIVDVELFVYVESLVDVVLVEVLLPVLVTLIDELYSLV